MATNKNLRTPIIKPRTQGGTFYTFASAAEDIGINIAEQKNRISLSYYVLLNIPEFEKIDSTSEYPEGCNVGDYTFAEYFQNYILNMEAVVRNQANYNFSSNQTISERVFWKWIAKYTNFVKDEETGYYTESDEDGNVPIVKTFGRISASSQRSDEGGMYNETFVQIPSSFGKCTILFKPFKDENYTVKRIGYACTNENGTLENIGEDEIDDAGNLSATGISASGSFDDSSANTYSADEDTDFLKVEFDVDNLREYYSTKYGEMYSNITLDDIAMGHAGEIIDDPSFDFNAALVYYSIYDSKNNKVLATNAYGLFVFDSTDPVGESSYKFRGLNKKTTTPTTSGTSYAFRLNIKTSSTYSGDITIVDNSTSAYSAAEDYASLLKNMSDAIDVLHSNASTLSNIATDNIAIKRLAADAIDKVNDIEKTVTALKTTTTFQNIKAGTVSGTEIYAQTDVYDHVVEKTDINALMENSEVTFNDEGKIVVSVNKDGLDGNARLIADKLSVETTDGMKYNDIMGLLAILFAKVSSLSEVIE